MYVDGTVFLNASPNSVINQVHAIAISAEYISSTIDTNRHNNIYTVDRDIFTGKTFHL